MRNILVFAFILCILTTVCSGAAYADDLLGKIESLIKLLAPAEQSETRDEEYVPRRGGRVIGRLNQIVQRASARFGIDADLIRAIIEVESGWNPSAVSVKGARGLMQLMPDTARQVGVRSIFDPHENIMGGANYYRQMYDMFGNHRKALIAYNCGPQRVIEGRIPSESVSYANAVMKVYKARKEGRSAI